MFSLTISTDNVHKLACIAGAAQIMISPGRAPANILVTNEWYLVCLGDSLDDVERVDVEDIISIISQLRRQADDIEKRLLERTEEV